MDKCECCKYRIIAEQAKKLFNDIDIPKRPRANNSEQNEKIQEVIDIFNETFEKRFKRNSAYDRMIIARLNDGYSLDDFKLVFQYVRWRFETYGTNYGGFDPRFFQIKTLCRPSNFPAYLDQATEAKEYNASIRG